MSIESFPLTEATIGNWLRKLLRLFEDLPDSKHPLFRKTPFSPNYCSLINFNLLY